tara:strand:+ start:217 stop:927 length:711 start_codon:yes stop_codon:yes gene_type:complete
VDSVSAFFAIAIGAGMFSAAIVKVLKQVFALRARYHRNRIKKWLRLRWLSAQISLEESSTVIDKSTTQLNQKAFVEAHVVKILKLVGNDEFAFFGQKSNHLIEHLRIIGYLVTSFPEKHKELAFVFTGVAAEEQAKAIAEARANPDKVNLEMAQIQRLTNIRLESHLREIQVSIEQWWELSLKTAATAITVLLAVLLFSSTDDSAAKIIAASFIGGFFFGPASNDLASAIAKLKGR